MKEQALTANPLISIIVPIFNMEPYLPQCIDSLLEQSYSNFEIILVDDGSTDASPAICDQYAQKDARIRVIHQKNGGVSSARNTALNAAQGEYLTQVDPDDWIAPDYLYCLLQLCQHFQVPLSACNHFISTPTHQECRFPDNKKQVVLSAFECCQNILYHGIPDVSGWGKLYHRSVYREIHYPTGKTYEDTYVIADILLAAGHLAFTSTPLYYYRIRDNSISRDVFSSAKMEFLEAVDHMTSTILRVYPELQNGAVRRKVHAALSTRRYFVNCEKALYPLRNELEYFVRKNAHTVVKDMRAPLRDKTAILALLLGSRCYDCFWKLYCQTR